VKPEMRDAFLDGIEFAVKSVGEESYDSAMEKLIGLTERFLYGLTMLRTREHAAVVLDMMDDPRPEEEPFAVALGKYLPQLAASTVGDVLQEFTKGLPAVGRPQALQHDERVALVREIGRLITEGYTGAVAKRHSARKFKVSVRMAERAWQNRGPILDGERTVTIQEARTWFKALLDSPGTALPTIPKPKS
jgi:hypothetical protein